MVHKLLVPLLSILLLFASCQQAQHDEKAIDESNRAYIEAFNKKDLNAFKELWAVDAEYNLPEAGLEFQGQNAIVEKFASIFKKHPNATIEINKESVYFNTPDEVVEVANAITREDGKELTHATYKIFYEKHGNKWLINELRNVRSGSSPQPSEHLKELEWLIGSWVDEDEDSTITLVNQWNKFHTFITQSFTVTVEGKFELEGKQLIAWDPINQNIRSWIFDSDGSFGEGTWRKEGNNWIVEISSTLTDGRKASAIYIMTPVDKDHYTWQSSGRSVGGNLLPDIAPVTVVRKG